MKNYKINLNTQQKQIASAVFDFNDHPQTFFFFSFLCYCFVFLLYMTFVLLNFQLIHYISEINIDSFLERAVWPTLQTVLVSKCQQPAAPRACACGLMVWALCRCGSRTEGWRTRGSVWPCPGRIPRTPASTPTWWRTRQLPEVYLTPSTRTCLSTTIHTSGSRQQQRPPRPLVPPRHLSPPLFGLSTRSAHSRTPTHGRSSCAASGTRDCISRLQASTVQQRRRQQRRQQRQRQRWAHPRPQGRAHVWAATAVRRQARWAPGAPALTLPAQPHSAPRADFCRTQPLSSARPLSHLQTSEKRRRSTDNSPRPIAATSLLFINSGPLAASEHRLAAL